MTCDRPPPDPTAPPWDRPPHEGFACPCGSGLYRVDQRLRGQEVRLLVNCVRCRVAVLDVPLASAIYAPDDLGDDHPATKPPPASWPYLVLLRQRGGPWQVIAKGSTLGSAWDAAMSSWQRGDLLAVPVRPVTNDNSEADQEPGPEADAPPPTTPRRPPPCFVGWFRKGRRGKWRRLTAGSSDREAFTRLQDEIRLQRLSGDLLVLPAEQHPDD